MRLYTQIAKNELSCHAPRLSLPKEAAASSSTSLAKTKSRFDQIRCWPEPAFGQIWILWIHWICIHGGLPWVFDCFCRCWFCCCCNCYCYQLCMQFIFKEIIALPYVARLEGWLAGFPLWLPQSACDYANISRPSS